MWSRVLLLLFATVVVVVVVTRARAAHAQAPPASFFDGRSNDELHALALDRHNDVLLRRAAATRLVITLADQGDVDGADRAAKELAGNIDGAAVKHVRAVRRRNVVHSAGVTALLVALAFAAVSLAAHRRALPGALRSARRVGPLVVGFLLYAGVAGGALASTYENSSALPFVWFAASMVPLVLLFRIWSAVGSPMLFARVGRGFAAVVATLAIGFLVVEHVNPIYLDGFGL